MTRRLLAVALSSALSASFALPAWAQDPPPAAERDDWLGKLQGRLAAIRPPPANDKPRVPDLLNVLATSINIMQVRITRSRMAGDPPELTISPRLAHLGLYEFHRAKEAIEEGREAVARAAYSLAMLTDPAK